MCRTKRGLKHIIWTKELDKKLIDEIVSGKNCSELETSMGMSYRTIGLRLKKMGFYGIVDVKRVMLDE